MFPPRSLYTVPLAHGRVLRLGERCLVMGIVNASPDSFAEPAVPHDPVALALEMEAAGADMIDIGGESTRPGAEPVSAEAESSRVLPVLQLLTGRLRIPVSVDTSRAEVAKQAIDAGAAIVNDVSGLRRDVEMAGMVAACGAALVITHMRGVPSTMYSEADYSDVVADVARELRQQMSVAAAAGVPVDRVIVDPGIGFAKRASHSYGVLARLPELAAALERPILAGPSRKSFMREATGERPAQQRDWGTAAAVTAAVLGGAHIVRVHAVEEMVQVVKVAEEIRRCSG